MDYTDQPGTGRGLGAALLPNVWTQCFASEEGSLALGA